MKYIIVSGGVISGLGKGITSASLAFLLKSRGFHVTLVKIDMYLNLDAGTIRPQEHGEVFVTHDGIETDEDLGHYERFIGENLTRDNYITTGQIYWEVIRAERAFEYKGEDVEAIPHVTDEIIRRIRQAGTKHNSDIVIVELGGTVGEYQNGIFYEATRILKLKHPKDLIHIHVTYIPYLEHLGEIKSKPAQTSVKILNGMGIQPDIIIARSEKHIDKLRLERLALFCNVRPECIFLNPNVDTIYRVPLIFHEKSHHLASTCLKLLSLKSSKHKDIDNWKKMVARATKKWGKTVKIAMVGKYFAVDGYELSDSYVSVIEAVKHAAWKEGVDFQFGWIDSEKIEKEGAESILSNYDGLIVPQGWGSRGTEGKIMAIKYAREHNLPFLGLCFGMQMATIEYGRNVLGLNGANSQEADPSTNHPVIHIMPMQKEYLTKKQYGGTIRLGAWPCKLAPDTIAHNLYKKYGSAKNSPWREPGKVGDTKQKYVIFERHRHRYEFNIKYKEDYERSGLIFSGTSLDGKLMEIIEIPGHKFFVGTQFHPEYISRPLTPHPLFLGFVKAMSGTN